MELDVTFWGAIIAGLLSFLTPCVLPLVPPYLCYLAGISLDQLTSENKTAVQSRRVFLTAVSFVFGFSVIFVLLGIGASAIGQFLLRNFEIFSMIAGVIIILMGLHFLGIFRISFLYREMRFNVINQNGGLLGGFIMGMAFAFGWVPCIGGVLTAILAVAGSKQTLAEGALLLTFYSMGLAIPFLIAALFSGSFINWMKRFSKHLHMVERVMGGLLVVTGILFMTNQMTVISNWFSETFPFLNELS